MTRLEEIMKAVCDTKGVWCGEEGCNQLYRTLPNLTYCYVDHTLVTTKCQYICNKTEFENLVDELSEAAWIPETTSEEGLYPEIEYGGKVYQKGKLYEFSDNGFNWYLGVLDSVEGNHYNSTSEKHWSYCQAITELPPLGTVTKAQTPKEKLLSEVTPLVEDKVSVAATLEALYELGYLKQK